MGEVLKSCARCALSVPEDVLSQWRDRDVTGCVAPRGLLGNNQGFPCGSVSPGAVSGTAAVNVLLWLAC